MLAFQVLLIGLLCRLGRRPGSIVLGAACATVAVLSFANMVNMAVDWLLPVYLALWLMPPPAVAGDVTGAARTVWRRNLLVQVLAVGAVGLVFLLDRLPYVVISSQRYGVVLESRLALPRLAWEGLYELFPPGLPAAVGILGASGLALALRGKHTRFIAVLALWTLAIGVLHWLVACRAPYVRNLGYVVPLVLLGVGLALDRLSDWKGTPPWRWGTSIAAAVLGLALIRQALVLAHHRAKLVGTAIAIAVGWQRAEPGRERGAGP